jgi:predicted  nucleic acid-binding Zn-ribbon protein
MLPDISRAIRLQILDDRAAELTKEIAALPKHIAEIEKKLKTQMMEAKTNDQYRAFQHEIDFCQQEIGRHEDRILVLMTESDPLDKAVKTAESALLTEKKQVEDEKAKARERTAVDQKEIDGLMQERKKILGEMDPKIASEYERIRKGRAGVAIAEVVQGRCSKCNMLLRPQFLQELKRGDAVMVCESCRRMLYWNPPQSVEDLATAGF